MPLQMGISTDMTTVRDDDAKSAINFVESPDAQQFEGLYDAHQEPYMTNAYPENLNPDLEDVNDLSLGDIAKSIQEAGKSVYEVGQKAYQAGKETLQDVGILPTQYPQITQQPQLKVPKSQIIPKPIKQEEEGIKEIQKYFQNPTPLVQSFIGNDRYAGKIDGNPGPKTQRIINKLEANLAKILGTNVVYGSILRSSGPQDIDLALQKVAAFRRMKKAENKAFGLSRDDRIYILSKILIHRK